MGTTYNCSCKKCGYTTDLKIGYGMKHDFFIETTKDIDNNTYNKDFEYISHLFDKGLISTVNNELGFYVPTKDQCVNEYPNRKPLQSLTIINNGYIIALCKECKEYISVLDLYYSFIYIIYNTGVIDEEAFRHFDINQVLKTYEAKRFIQYCHKCNHKLTILKSIEKKLENNTLKCPKCGNKMKSEIVCMWD